MSRHALRTFFTRVVPIALPLLAGCSNSCPHELTIVVDGGFSDVDAACTRLCTSGFPPHECEVGPMPDTLICHFYDCTGRRPEGFVETKQERWARMAELEAASVHAFDVLAEELHELGARRSG